MRATVRVSGRLWILLLGVIAAVGIGITRRGETAGAVWSSLWPWAVAATAAVIHEMGHLVAAWGCGVGVRGLSLDVLGARIELSGTLSYGRELLVAAAGPYISLMSAATAYPFAARGGSAAAVFCGASLVLGGVNLLPVGTLDGGRMLSSAVARLWGDRAAVRVLRGTTGVCLGLLWLLSVYGLLRGGGFLSAFAFSLCLLGRLIEGEA